MSTNTQIYCFLAAPVEVKVVVPIIHKVNYTSKGWFVFSPDFWSIKRYMPQAPNCQSQPTQTKQAAQALQGSFAWIFRSRNPLTCSRVIMEVRKLELEVERDDICSFEKSIKYILDGKWYGRCLLEGVGFNNAWTLIIISHVRWLFEIVCMYILIESGDWEARFMESIPSNLHSTTILS